MKPHANLFIITCWAEWYIGASNGQMKSKKSLLITGGILLLFILTNPSISAFKAYEGSNTYEGLKRPLNLFICSVYKDQRRHEYLGVFGNFVRVGGYNYAPVGNTPVDTIKTTSIPIDTSKLSYVDKVYFALKDNLTDFNMPLDTFEISMRNKEYAMRAYKALRENVPGFNKTPNQFLTAINN